MKLYGVIIRDKESDHTMKYWFDTIEARDQQINFYSKSRYEIVEYISEQMELNFDTREG